MVYPSRGTWSFRNDSRGLDFWMVLDSISITQAHTEGGVAVLAGRVVDLAEDMVWEPEDLIVAKFNNERIFAGHVKSVGDTWTDPAGLGKRVFDIEAQDFTAKLDDAVVRRRKDRKKETARKRVKWILSFMERVFPVEWDLSDIPDVKVEKQNFYGMSVNDALTATGDDANLHHYIDFDDDEDGKPTVIVLRSDSPTATIKMNNATPNYIDSFPFREFLRTRDSVELATAVLVEPDKRKHSQWSHDLTQIAAYGRHERFVSDVSVHGKQAARNVGSRALGLYDEPQMKGSLLSHEPGIYAGKKFRLTEARHGIVSELLIVESVDIVAVDPHDEDQTAYMKSYVGFTDRRRRPKSKRNRNAKGKGGTAVDQKAYDITDWITATPPGLSDGATVHFDYAGRVMQNVSNKDLVVTLPHWQDLTSWSQRRVGSYLNGYSAWNSRPAFTDCHGLDNAFSGFHEQEEWLAAVMPAHPANAASIEVTLPIGGSGGWTGPGYGEIAPVEIVAHNVKPSDMRQGFVVGSGMRNTSPTVNIPAALAPPEGQLLYAGWRPSWMCTGVANLHNYACGWTWPFMCNSWNYDAGGTHYVGLSGRVSVGGAVGGYDGKWKVWDAGEPTLGTLKEQDKAPFGGGQTIHDSGFEGAGDAWSMSPAGFVVSDSAPAGKGILVRGEREDHDQEEGPWGDVGWAHIIHFTVTAHGATGDAGTRHIQSTVTGQGEQAIGTVHLGDADFAEGISVQGPSARDYAAKALTLDVEWMAMFDTRSNQYVRGKMWPASEKHPAAWDVEVEMDGTEDDLDRWLLWLRAGNDGTEHGVTVTKVRAIEGAVSGQRVVKQLVGFANGHEKSFKTSQPFVEGSLKVFVNGLAVRAKGTNGEECRFNLDFWPTYNSIVRVTYVVD